MVSYMIFFYSNITDGRAITKEGKVIYILPSDLYSNTSTHETGHTLDLTDRYSSFRFKDSRRYTRRLLAT